MNDPRINAISFETRGVWITLLCLMWRSPRRGVLLNEQGKAISRQDLVRLFDLPGPMAIDSLLNLRLLEINDDGELFSPELLQKARLSELRSEAGRKGGAKTQAKKATATEPHQDVKAETPPQSPAIEPPVEPEAPAPSTEVEKADTPTLPFEPPKEDEPTDPPELTEEQKQRIKKKTKHKYAEYVTLTTDEYTKLCEAHGEDGARRMIEILNNYKGSKGKRYKSDYLAILNWVVDRYNEEITRNNGIYQQQHIGQATCNGGGGNANAPGYPSGTPTPNGTGVTRTGFEAPPDYNERF